MVRKTPWGEMLMGAALLAFLFQPSWLTKINEVVTPLLNVIPEEWKIFGTASMAIFGAGLGLLIGYIIYRT